MVGPTGDAIDGGEPGLVTEAGEPVARGRNEAGMDVYRVHVLSAEAVAQQGGVVAGAVPISSTRMPPVSPRSSSMRAIRLGRVDELAGTVKGRSA